MANLEHTELVSQYFESIRTKYPNLSLEDIQAICNIPATFIKNTIRSGELQDINIKYVGKLYVRENRLKRYIETLKQLRKSDILSEEEFNIKMEKAQYKLKCINIDKNESTDFIVTE